MVVIHEKSVLGCALCICVCLTLEKNIYEKHLYDKIPLECEARHNVMMQIMMIVYPL